jgi:hypothetical protein
VLKEILDGNISDPPGVSFYTQRLNNKGEPAIDSHGIPLLDCSRGSNDVEPQRPLPRTAARTIGLLFGGEVVASPPPSAD